MIKKLKEIREQNRLRFFTKMIYGGLLGIFFLFLIILLSIFLYSNHNTNNMFIFNTRPTLIITGSMEPNIVVNSLVFLEPVEFEDIEVGDIIRYTSYQGYSVLHRVISKNSSYVVTKGDNNNRPDEFVVTISQITGRVTEIHNEVADIITFIFGRFEYDNMLGSILRFCLGYLFIGITIVVIITMFILIFEMITTTLFFRKYKDLVSKSSYWMESIETVEDKEEFVESYLKNFKKSNIFKKIILAYKFRRWYNGLCNIEKEVLKTEKRLKTLNKCMID